MMLRDQDHLHQMPRSAYLSRLAPKVTHSCSSKVNLRPRTNTAQDRIVGLLVRRGARRFADGPYWKRASSSNDQHGASIPVPRIGRRTRRSVRPRDYGPIPKNASPAPSPCKGRLPGSRDSRPTDRVPECLDELLEFTGRKGEETFQPRLLTGTFTKSVRPSSLITKPNGIVRIIRLR